jgi:phosphinothricin acetyltransferase
VSDIVIRAADRSDLPALLDIYNHYIVNTPITFDIEAQKVEQREKWFAQFAPTGRHRCFVAVRDERAIGWACSARFKDRAAYDTTIETSVYVAPGLGGQGIGSSLYRTLFDAIAGEDVHRAFAGITLPNPASEAIHKSFGFEHVGTYHEVGRKFGRWWDTGLYLKSF